MSSCVGDSNRWFIFGVSNEISTFGESKSIRNSRTRSLFPFRSRTVRLKDAKLGGLDEIVDLAVVGREFIVSVL